MIPDAEPGVATEVTNPLGDGWGSPPNRLPHRTRAAGSVSMAQASERPVQASVLFGGVGGACVQTIRLRVEPVFCGPVSLGTIELIQLVRARLGLSLAEAKACVDRCVFGGEAVTLAAPSEQAAEAFAREVAALVSPAKFQAEVVAD